ncbi:MAG TPA: hypothetical protein DD381_06000 [Lentisphaeria bacterium]|nr:MAG: hypothetical protein A2X47_14105 [Lentisphaerae bacterium GWF2_38_69]HBM15878.1 hypothetical protein [Lentisphaeria bacterium]
MIVKIPFASEIVQLIGKDNVVKVFPLGSDQPKAAWIEINPVDPFSLYAFVENEIVPDLSYLTPEQKKLPRVYGLYPVKYFYDKRYFTKIETEKDFVIDNLTEEQKNMLALPESAIFHDDQSDFVYRAKGQKAFDMDKGISLDFDIEKVRIKKGILYREFSYEVGRALKIINLTDSSSLSADDVICMYPDKGLKDADHVCYTRTKWLFLPEDQIPVVIPDLVKPGFYVPPSAIIHAAEGANFVYINDNGKAKLLQVKLVGRATDTYAIEADGLKEDTQIIVIEDKSILNQLYDGAPITVKGIVNPPYILEKRRVLPIVPVEQLEPYSFFN